ncbi:MAG: hypothetical protein K6G50_12655 [bacterium]|nr:hypothetical protein [bacterium]
MDNKTICEFVNSKDIRSHLEDIGYQFSSAEAAWLVDKCDHITLEERHAAWQDIIGTMPDCALVSGHWKLRQDIISEMSGSEREQGHFKNEKNKIYDSLHGVLQKVIARNSQILAEFYSNSGNAIYQYAINYRDSDVFNDYDDSPLFSEYENCLNAVKKELAGNSYEDYDIDDDDDDDGNDDYDGDDNDGDNNSGNDGGAEEREKILYVTIRKNYIDNPKANISIKLNENYEVTSISKEDTQDEEESFLQEVFDDLWLSFPAPFKKGDIVWHKNRRCEAGPLVVFGTTPIRSAEDGYKGYDSSDMNVWGYFQRDDGKLFYEVTGNYMDFEYYPEEKLVGKKRILKALSNFLYGKIEIDLFSEAYQYILLEEYLKDNKPYTYTDEALRLAGLTD